MTILEYLILFVSVMLGGSIYFLLRKPNPRILKLSLSFSGAFLFTLCITHLMPEVYAQQDSSIGMMIMVGFFLQVILELFSEGIEHGHVHIHTHHHNAFPLTMMISLCLHSFLEAMPLTSQNHAGHLHEHQHSLLFGIALHHIPVAFALMSMLIGSKVSKGKSFIFLSIFALMGPLGAIFSSAMSEFLTGEFDKIYHYCMAIVIGIFLHISTTILFESGSDHRFNLYKMATIIVGGLFALSLL